MKNLIDFALKEKYEKVKKLRSRLEDMKNIINWNMNGKLSENKITEQDREEELEVLEICH